MEVIVLVGDSDEEHQQTRLAQSSSNFIEAERPAKRRRQEPSSTYVSNTVDLSDGVSHVSDTVLEPCATEAPTIPAVVPASDADSPALSPQQARAAPHAIYHVADACRLYSVSSLTSDCLCSKKLKTW